MPRNALFCAVGSTVNGQAAVSTAAGEQVQQARPISAQQAQQWQQERTQSSATNGTQQLHVLHQYRQEHPQGAADHIPMQQFEVESETPVHQRYLTVYNRKVKFCAPERPTEVGFLPYSTPE
jgi:hypothetical protein